MTYLQSMLMPFYLTKEQLKDTATRKIIATYGVLCLLCNLLNTVGIMPERPIENNKRLELIKIHLIQ